MIESPCQFGPDAGLVGVVTLPAPDQACQAVGVLLYNAGVIARYGPHRINVKLARVLAQAGHVVLRFDLSGVGDSPHRFQPRPLQEQAQEDIQAALDHLERACGVRQVVLVGICSGAAHAYRVSQQDSRVVGILMMDGFGFPTWQARWVRRWKRFRAAPWSAIPGAVWQSLLRDAHKGRSTAVLARSDMQSTHPTRQAFSCAMQSLVDRGVSVFLLYSGSVLDQVSYAAQMRHAFAGAPWLDQVQCELDVELDHTLTTLAAQQRFIGLVRAWLARVVQRAGIGENAAP